MKQHKAGGALLLSLAVLIWGSSFIVQSISMETLEPFTFNGIRALLGALVLLPIFLIKNSREKRAMTPDELAARRSANRKGILYGFILGLVLCVGSNFQQQAFAYSTAGKIAFITASYMFIVPLIGLLLKRRLPWLTWVCVAFGFFGMFLLCVDPAEMGSLNRGDVLTMVCAVAYAFHILFIDRFVSKADGILLSCVQFFTVGVITVILSLLFENATLGAIRATVPYILFSGIVVCAVAYTLQIIGQKTTEPTVASLIMCMESVVAMVLSAILLNERMNPREIIGCLIMLSATVVSQLSDALISKKNRTE